jgi:hypothetical protein
MAMNLRPLPPLYRQAVSKAMIRAPVDAAKSSVNSAMAAEDGEPEHSRPAAGVAAPGPVRYYPIAGGILKSFVRSESTATDIIAIDGLENCLEVLTALRKGEVAPRFIEALACSGGCINGPDQTLRGLGSGQRLHSRRIRRRRQKLPERKSRPN